MGELLRLQLDDLAEVAAVEVRSLRLARAVEAVAAAEQSWSRRRLALVGAGEGAELRCLLLRAQAAAAEVEELQRRTSSSMAERSLRLVVREVGAVAFVPLSELDWVLEAGLSWPASCRLQRGHHACRQSP